MKQYLENTQGKSSKFWEIELEGQYLNIQNGKIGAKARVTRKDLKTKEKAFLAFKREIVKKRKGGYIDPKFPVAKLELESTPFNDTVFKHEAKVKKVYYYTRKDLIVSATSNHFHLWSPEGTLLDTYKFSDASYFFGRFFIKTIPHTGQLLIYKKKTYRDNHIYIFDCEDNKLELVRDQQIEIPIEGYFGDIDLDKEYIYIAYTGGFSLLDYDFNILQTLTAPHEHENSSGAVVSATSQRIAFIQYGGHGNSEKVLIVDLEGNEIAQFETNAHGSMGIQAQFNAQGTAFYAASSSNYATTVQVWDVEKGIKSTELVNYSSSGDVLSFSISENEEWLAIRVAGIDVILWNVMNETVVWVKENEALSASLAFVDDQKMYQSAGNRIYPIQLDSGEPLLAIKGLTENCLNLHFDDTQEQLWVLSGKAVNCFNKEGAIERSLDISSFVADKVEGKMLLKRRYQNYGGSYSWFDYETGQETPIVSGVFKHIDFDENRILSTTSYFSREKKFTKLWSHSGKMLRSFKPTKDVDAYLWKEDDFVVINGKKLEFWTMEEKKASLSIKNAHSKAINALYTFPEKALVLSIAGNEIKLWDGLSDSELFFDLLLDEVKSVIQKPYLSELLIVDKMGSVYTFNIAKRLLKQIASTNTEISVATLRKSGELYLATTNLEIVKIDLSNVLSIEIKQSVTPEFDAIDWSILENDPSSEDLLTWMKSLSWNSLNETNFLKIRKVLEYLEAQEGISAGHHFFTKSLLESDACLRHSFAHEEKMNAFAMSPDGQYLAVGTWVGDDYQEDGTIQIWETSTGRSVNLLKDHYGGIGWPDYPYMLQWSKDSQFIGAGLNTNVVAKLNPFSSSATPLASACITNGWSRPPAWSWQAGEDAFVISCWHNSEIPVGITSNRKLDSYEDNAKWLSPKLNASIKEALKKEDLQPYKWCSTTQDGQFIYGYNDHNQVYGIDIKTKQVVWLKKITGVTAFSPLDHFMVYQNSDQLIFIDIRTGKKQTSTTCLIGVKGIQFAPDGKRFAVYSDNNVLIYDDEQVLGKLTTNKKIVGENRAYSELRSVQFDPTGTKIAVLLNSNKIQIWTVETTKQVQEFPSNVEGIYWGNSIVGVGAYEISFYKEDGTIINTSDKELQVEAYNELYDTSTPLQLGKRDLTFKYPANPNYPLYDNGRKVWVSAIPTGVVIANEINVDVLDKHLSYAYKNKYAWPYRWGGDENIYSVLYDAKDNPKLELTTKEKTLFKAPKKAKKKKTGIDFTKGGSLLDVINVHQKSLADLTSGWHYHISEHKGIIARKLVLIEEYKKAIKNAEESPEWYVLVANLGFVAIDLAKKDLFELARVAFDKGQQALDKGTEKDKNGWAATFVYAPLAAAADLLGLDDIAKEYFELSYQKIEEESNNFEKYTRLGTCYALCNQYEKAMEVMSNGPWNEGWFSSYQVEFILLLMELGKLDLAMQYFDLGLEKCGKIDEFDLLDKGFAILLERKKYQTAIEWMQKFPGLSTRHCEELLIKKYIEVNETELGTAYLLKEIEKSRQYNGSVMEYIRMMSYINPDEAKKQISQYSTTTNAYYKDRYYEDMGRAKSNLGLLEDAFSVADQIHSVRNKVLYLTGLLERSEKGNSSQLEILYKVTELIVDADMVTQETIKFYIKLSKAARELGEEKQSEELLVQAKELANKSKGDDRYTVSELQKLYLDLELIEASYKMFKKQTPANRKYGMKDYALAIAQKGYWKTAAELLMTIPAKDLNDRPSAAMKIIESYKGTEV